MCTTTLAVYNAIMCCCWRNHLPEEYLFGMLLCKRSFNYIKLSIFIFHLFMAFFGLEVFYCFNIIHQDACSDFEVVASFEFILLCKVMSYVLHKYIQDIISFFVIIWRKFIHFDTPSSFFFILQNKQKPSAKESFGICMWIWQSMHCNLLYNLFSHFFLLYFQMSWTYIANLV